MNIILYIKISVLLLGGGTLQHCQAEKMHDRLHLPDINVPASIDTLKIPARDKSQNLPPHSAKIKAEIINFEHDTKNQLLHLKVKEILGYGASAPVLSTGQVITLNIDNYLMATDESKEWMDSGKTAVAIINHTFSMKMDSTPSNWSIAEINEYRQPD